MIKLSFKGNLLRENFTILAKFAIFSEISKKMQRYILILIKINVQNLFYKNDVFEK